MKKMLTIGKETASLTRPLLVTPIMSTNMQDLIRDLEQTNASDANLVEWRIDFFQDITNLNYDVLKELIDYSIKPIIFTWRTAEEGGNRPFDEVDYRRLYHMAIKLGIAAVDIEYRLLPALTDLVQLAKEKKIPVIGSWHDFMETPEYLTGLLEQLFASHADIVKVAVMPKNQADVSRLMMVADQYSNQDKPLIAISMGILGQITRFKAVQFGSQLTFGVLDATSAPGQPTIAELNDYFNQVD